MTMFARCHFWLFALLTIFARCQHCLDNGLALTPPLGWISTERFQCLIDCINYPDDCISERLVKTTADAIVKQGLRDVGYRYIILGDCWMNKTRDYNGNLQPDPIRFPQGMKALAQYVHSKRLLLGLQIDLGNSSCSGYPGSYGQYKRDAQTLVTWGVDYVRATACYLDNSQQLNTVYPTMGDELNKTGRHVIYDCNWPAELQKHGQEPDYSHVSKTCNVFSTAQPMIDSWESLEKTIKHFSDLSHSLVNYSCPGSWSFPNPLLVGDFGLSDSQQTMQLVVWSIMNAPLLLSVDVRQLAARQRALLLNKATLTIDQDVAYQMAEEVLLTGQVHIWRKCIQPKGSHVLVFMYFNISGGPTKVSVVLRDIGVHGAEWYKLTDLLSGQVLGMYQSWYTFDGLVDPVGVLLIKAEALP